MTPLTRREIEVRDLLLLGLENKEIAARLGCSHRTIEDHRAHVFRKCGVANTVQLVRKVYHLEDVR